MNEKNLFYILIVIFNVIIRKMYYLCHILFVHTIYKLNLLSSWLSGYVTLKDKFNIIFYFFI